jgi:DNA polymerase-1
VGEAPGKEEVREGTPFVGQSGLLLRALIEEVGGNPDEVYYTNAIMCRPAFNAKPNLLAITTCQERLISELKEKDCELVLALGRTAQETLNVDGTQMGVAFEREGKIVIPGWHPAFVLRKPSKASELKLTLDRAVNGPIRIPINRNPDVIYADALEEIPDLSIDDLVAGKMLDVTPYHEKSLKILKEWLDKCPDDAMVAFDIETDQIQWFESREAKNNQVLMLQLCWDPDYAVIVSDVMLYDVEGVIPLLQEFFDRVRTVGHNAKFDVVFMRHAFDLRIHQDFDTMLARYVLDESLPRALKKIVQLEMGMLDYEVDTILPYLDSRADRYSKVPFTILAEYGALDVVACLWLEGHYRKKLQATGQWEWPFLNVIMPAANAFVELEITGMHIDEDQLTVIADKFQEQMDKLEAKMQEMTGNPEFNPRSPKQLAWAIFDKFGLPVQKLYGKADRTTCKEALVNLKDRHPFVGIVLEYRRIHKMRSSYAINILKKISVTDSRVHADFRITGTEVGRIAVRNPALQTIPRPDDYYGALIRSAFTSPPGYKLIEVDYSQAELRCQAAITNEEFLLDVYMHDRDLHSEVAEAMYGPEFTKAQRAQCKMFNFSYAYGGTEYSFAKDAGLPMDKAKAFVQDYNKNMPRLANFRKKQYNLLVSQGYIDTRFGRRRVFPLITKGNLDEARKTCVHMPIAGGASDLTLLSAIRCILEEGFEVCLLVHDSIMAYAPDDEAEAVAQRIHDIMKETAETYYPEVVWKVDAEVKDRWTEPIDPPEEVIVN